MPFESPTIESQRPDPSMDDQIAREKARAEKRVALLEKSGIKVEQPDASEAAREAMMADLPKEIQDMITQDGDEAGRFDRAVLASTESLAKGGKELADKFRTMDVSESLIDGFKASPEDERDRQMLLAGKRADGKELQESDLV